MLRNKNIRRLLPSYWLNSGYADGERNPALNYPTRVKFTMFNNQTQVSASTTCLIFVATLAITIGLIQGARSLSAQSNLAECMTRFANCEPKASF